MADSPLWLENAGAIYNAGEYRRWLHRLHGGRPGIFAAGELKVTQRGAGANLSVDVAAGACLIAGTETTSGASKQGLYFFNEEAVTNVAITAGGASPRTDLVVVRVRDQEYSGGTNTAVIEVVQGVEGGGTPATPNNSFVLAEVAVAAGASSITNANITDKRDVSSDYHYAAPWGASWGERTRAVATSSTNITSGNTVLTANTINVIAGRRLLVHASAALFNAVDGERGRIWIEEQVNGGAWAEIAEVIDFRENGAANARNNGSVTTRVTITADGTRRYRLRGERVSGTGTITAEASATNPTELVVEDVGPGALA